MTSEEILKKLKDYRNLNMPDNNSVVSSSINKVFASTLGSDIKAAFSDYIQRVHDVAYDEYLESEKLVQTDAIRTVFRELAVGLKSTDTLIDLFANESGALDSFFQTFAQSRRSRAGKVFELALHNALLNLDYPHTYQPKGIDGKPDFVFPSKDHYLNNPGDCIVFTAKRTLRERWRQIVTEGARARGVFLATLDPQITTANLELMHAESVTVVVTKSCKMEKYESVINAITFEDFFEDHLDPAVTRWKRNKIIDKTSGLF